MPNYKPILCIICWIFNIQIGFSQQIDSSSLKILKDAISNLHNANYSNYFINYRILADTAIHKDEILYNNTVNIRHLANDTILLLNSNSNANLITKDTVFKYTHVPSPQVEIVKNWSKFELSDYELNSIFDYNYLTSNLDSTHIQTSNKEYVITFK